MWRIFSKVKLENTSYFKFILKNFLLWVTITIGFIFSHLFIYEDLGKEKELSCFLIILTGAL